MQNLVEAAEIISLFCRLNMNVKKDLPVRSSEMGLLIYLVKSNLEKTPLKIAEFFKVSKPMVTAMMTSLIKNGYITKVYNQSDRRSFSLLATDKAHTLVEDAYTQYYKTMEILKKKMGDTKFSLLIEAVDTANKILLEEKNNG